MFVAPPSSRLSRCRSGSRAVSAVRSSRSSGGRSPVTPLRVTLCRIPRVRRSVSQRVGHPSHEVVDGRIEPGHGPTAGSTHAHIPAIRCVRRQHRNRDNIACVKLEDRSAHFDFEKLCARSIQAADEDVTSHRTPATMAAILPLPCNRPVRVRRGTTEVAKPRTSWRRKVCSRDGVTCLLQ